MRVHDKFLDLGGHSLAATRVVAKAVREFQLNIERRSLFQSPTVAEVATIVTARQVRNLNEQKRGRIVTELELISNVVVEQRLIQIK